MKVVLPALAEAEVPEVLVGETKLKEAAKTLDCRPNERIVAAPAAEAKRSLKTMIYTCFHHFSSMELVSQCINAAKTRIWRFPHSAIPGHGPFCSRIPFRLRLEPLKPCLISLAFQRLPGPIADKQDPSCR